MSDNDDALVACIRRDARANEEMGRVVIGQPDRMREAANRIESLTSELDKWRKIAGEMAGALDGLLGWHGHDEGCALDPIYGRGKKCDCGFAKAEKQAAAALTTYRTGESE